MLDVLTPEDVRILAESEDELNRLGEFERIFPSPSSSRYLRFFECPRYLNIMLDQWEQKHWNNRTKGTHVPKMHCIFTIMTLRGDDSLRICSAHLNPNVEIVEIHTNDS